MPISYSYLAATVHKTYERSNMKLKQATQLDLFGLVPALALNVVLLFVFL